MTYSQLIGRAAEMWLDRLVSGLPLLILALVTIDWWLSIAFVSLSAVVIGSILCRAFLNIMERHYNGRRW
ncbi:MAG: hypothetical protein OXG33_11885 [Chloroflexi bacterium]|nr:hypothetical protein [Chloroflexota bacterium]MCY4114614.1 hypothetical protein [Chloroflexota bacterium]